MGHRCYVEFCINCKHHNWCTRHKEEKYLEYFNKLKMKIMQTAPQVITYPNTIPLGFEDNFFTEDEEISMIARYGKVKFPRVGAFEVYFNRKVIYSKLSNHGLWPNIELVAKKVAEELERISRPPVAKPVKRTVKRKKKRLWSAKARTRTSFTNISHTSPKHTIADVPKPKPTVKARQRPTTAKPAIKSGSQKKQQKVESFDVEAYLRKYDPGRKDTSSFNQFPKKDLFEFQAKENILKNENPIEFFDYDDVPPQKAKASPIKASTKVVEQPF